MTLPASGSITFSQISQIVYNSSSATTSLGTSDVRYLLGVASGQISISSGYSKPTTYSYSYTSPGTYTLVTPPYQYMDVYTYGGGQGGQGGSGGGTCTQWCGVYCFVSYCCNVSGPGVGGDGSGSSFSGAGITSVVANAGTSGGAGGGSGGSVTTGGGGAGGGGGGATGCAGGTGATGNAGGRTINTYTHGGGGPAYALSCTIVVGSGGSATGNAGAGGNGTVNVNTR